MKDTLLISKDVCKPEYFSCYGSKVNSTPNIDQLAKSGTVFENFYTVAPSTSMAFMGMFAGINPFEIKNRRTYKHVDKYQQTLTLFDIFEERGYDCHIIWDVTWVKLAKRYTEVYGKHTTFHNLQINQRISSHLKAGNRVIAKKDYGVTEVINKEIEIIKNQSIKPVFIWIHCPHVLLGSTGYGSDIHVFDEIVGRVVKYFERENIYLTADHGHMDLTKSIPVYGFHLYESAIRIPLITPRMNNKKREEEIISNKELKSIILNREYKVERYVYSDTQYYVQPDRKIMIRKGRFKYIYNKRYKTEELYDLMYDPAEDKNLLLDSVYDFNRERWYFSDEIHNYQFWSEAEVTYFELKNEKDKIWRKGSILQESIYKAKSIIKRSLGYYLNILNVKYKPTGRWGSRAKQTIYQK